MTYIVSGGVLSSTHSLTPEIGRRATLITGEPRESTFLSQQLPITLQGGNAVAFSTLLTPIRRRCSHTLLSTMLSLRLCASVRKQKIITAYLAMRITGGFPSAILYVRHLVMLEAKASKISKL